ncbi:MAG: lipopolysaccharide biosynthesis glycosyltransferase [Microgenomates bacterium 39_6]|nr:MAG: lipopolysaccharide biosynthesis glycosyltransferase [Microgenomates bacterium 39_6]
MSLSIAIATYNEEKNLPACLRAVKSWVDEIVIVDGSSTDKTRQIAKKFGAKVIKTTNKPIFHINKQMALDACQGEWILQLDADEIVDKDLKAEVLKIAQEGSDFDAFSIPRKNFFLGRWLSKGGQYPDTVIRFFKKGKAYLPCQSVHEQMSVPSGKIGRLSGHLLHYPYPNFAEYLNKFNRYTELTAKEYQNNPKIKPNIWHYIIIELKAMIEFLSRYLRHKGFLDGFPGLVFALFSALHYPVAFIKYWEKKHGSKK